MSKAYYHLFDTALGRCGIAWGERGVISASFPEETDAGTRDRLKRNDPDLIESEDLPDTVSQAVKDIRDLFEGGKPDLKEIELDMTDIELFEQEVYRLSRDIHPGETRTYGDLARKMGDVAHSRRVGQALGRNPFPIIVPCHRIVGAGGTMTGFSAPGGTETKRRLLKIEGAIGPDLLDLLDAD